MEPSIYPTGRSTTRGRTGAKCARLRTVFPRNPGTAVGFVHELAAAWRAARTSLCSLAPARRPRRAPRTSAPGRPLVALPAPNDPGVLRDGRGRARDRRYKGEKWQVIQAAPPKPGTPRSSGRARVAWRSSSRYVSRSASASGVPAERPANIHGLTRRSSARAAGSASPGAGERAWEAATAVPRRPCGGPWKPATNSFASRSWRPTCGVRRGAAECDLWSPGPRSWSVQSTRWCRGAAGRRPNRHPTASDMPYHHLVDWKTRGRRPRYCPPCAVLWTLARTVRHLLGDREWSSSVLVPVSPSRACICVRSRFMPV